MQVIPGMDILMHKVTCSEDIIWTADFPADHDPVAMAIFWKEQGAESLYVADLEGARYGTPMTLDIIQKIIETVDIKIDLGGGVRSPKSAEKVFDAGVDKIVIGTYAALEKDFIKYMIDTYGDKVIISLGNLNGFVAIHDWTVRLDETVFDFAMRMEDMGAKSIVYNDISRKGVHGGPNMYMIKKMIETINVPLIIGCGISSLEDIKELTKFGNKISAVIIVSALYNQIINYNDALIAAN